MDVKGEGQREGRSGQWGEGQERGEEGKRGGKENMGIRKGLRGKIEGKSRDQIMKN